MRLLPALSFASLAAHRSLAADPTWPYRYDDLEEVMFQLKSFRARGFADNVSPCSTEAFGPGRQSAAEWVRTAFHDVATRNLIRDTGGLDGSLQYELDSGENIGSAFNSTLVFFADYFNHRTGVADLIAAGVATAVRACGGPLIPVRPGRADAAEAGPLGVPQPENPAATFEDQFARMGFSVAEMIQATACGHTLGGVHAANFPQIVPPGTVDDGRAVLDSTPAGFDSRIATEYMAGSTRNPLVVGPSVAVGLDSDAKVFGRDGNATMAALAAAGGPDVFSSACRAVLQKLIETVPGSVRLAADPIAAYLIKPVGLQLTLGADGGTLRWAGYVRVRTTEMPGEEITSLTIAYKARAGLDGGGAFDTTVDGIGSGLDDTFSFFPISADIPVSTGISSFTITVNLRNGTRLPFDNNGNSYPLGDAIMFQTPQSCLLSDSGAFTATAAVRNDRAHLPVYANISYKIPQPDSPVPRLAFDLLPLQGGGCVGSDYTLFSANTTIPGGLSGQSLVDFISGEGGEDGNDAGQDRFKRIADIGGTYYFIFCHHPSRPRYYYSFRFYRSYSSDYYYSPRYDLFFHLGHRRLSSSCLQFHCRRR